MSNILNPRDSPEGAEIRSDLSRSGRFLLTPQIIVNEDKDQHTDDHEEKGDQSRRVVEQSGYIEEWTVKQHRDGE